ncbi:MAG: response regulator transcription factor [Myxococcota bacterium]|jgi:DNA-binding response OmpR family regulator|nr:DNA-binding response regulator [Deltaproteobacteria bacterium]MCP4241359.1 response regulator transcription factor [bacterium]MDP6074258.1 response regulator transcription factor [Myxococcota bacterium]MDP6244560.1 response regulator transcription factor [Myxococcota bacterium]MDP7074636.1 response regulator transcription factor [Myxococcota bacterium]
MARILVVEDEDHIARGLQFNLEAEGHEVTLEASGSGASERLESADAGWDLVILDLMLPGMSGFEVARRARAAGTLIPILILTAKDDTRDLVRGLEEGGDDYLTKPFELDELLARVRGLLRRRRWDGAESPSLFPREVWIGESQVHFDRFEIDTPRGKISLTTREAGLLRALVAREGEAVTRGELLEEVWGLRPDTRTRVVDSFVVRLRRYLERDPSHPRHIVSVRGHGYRFLR